MVEDITAKELKDYVDGSVRTLLTINCPNKLFLEFKKYCLKEAGGNKILALEKLITAVSVDEKTEILLQRDDELKAEIDNIYKELEVLKSRGDSRKPMFFRSER